MKTEIPSCYLNAVTYIKEVYAKHGKKIKKRQAYAAWLAYSDSMSAGWMSLPDDEKILMKIVDIYL